MAKAGKLSKKAKTAAAARHGMRERILDAAMSLMSEKGMDAVFMREIAGHVRVTKPVLYYYFKDKDDLCCQMFARTLKGADVFTTELETGNLPALAAVTRLFEGTFRLMRRKPDFARLVHREMSNPRACSKFARMIIVMRERMVRILGCVLDKAETAGEIPPGSSRDVLYMIDAVQGSFMRMACCDELRKQDAGLPARLAAMIIAGAKTRGKSRKSC